MVVKRLIQTDTAPIEIKKLLSFHFDILRLYRHGDLEDLGIIDKLPCKNDDTLQMTGPKSQDPCELPAAATGIHSTVTAKRQTIGINVTVNNCNYYCRTSKRSSKIFFCISSSLDLMIYFI